MASTVAAIRCSHSAAFSLAGARIEAMRAASGMAIPVIAAPGAHASREQRAHLRRVEERALPRRAVLDRDAAQIHAGKHTQRKRQRGAVKDPRRASAVKRSGHPRPRFGECGVARVAGRAARRRGEANQRRPQ
jgi:hypothetical protein